MATSITEFLLARIAEDEGGARAASGGTVEGSPGNWRPVAAGDEWEANEGESEIEVLVALRQGLPRPPAVLDGKWGQVAEWDRLDQYGSGHNDYAAFTAPHIARWDPRRVLAECTARRSLVNQGSSLLDGTHLLSSSGSPLAKGVGLRILVTLAAVYADHPDYRSEWAL